MDKIKRKNWFSITAYLLCCFGVLGILLYLAETYFPSPSSSLVPQHQDRISRWFIDGSRMQSSYRSELPDRNASPQHLSLRINEKIAAGKSELTYRGLAGKNEFRIDVIILELDPQVAYRYCFKISEAKKTFRLANRNYRLLSAKKTVLKLMRIQQ